MRLSSALQRVSLTYQCLDLSDSATDSETESLMRMLDEDERESHNAVDVLDLDTLDAMSLTQPEIWSDADDLSQVAAQGGLGALSMRNDSNEMLNFDSDDEMMAFPSQPEDDEMLDFDQLPASAASNSVLRSLRSFALDLIVQLADRLGSACDSSRVVPIGLSFTARNASQATKRIQFPDGRGSSSGAHSLGSSPKSQSDRSAVILRVIELVCDNLELGGIMSKRDLYYKDVQLFRKQSNVDAVIDDLCATLSFRRVDLSITAASKGLFAGDLVVELRDGISLDGFDSTAGFLIPSDSSIASLEFPDGEPDFVLIVEKEAVFRTLAAAADLYHGPKVLLTGKGYPDVSTRELIKRLSDLLPTTPILALVDADPFGIEIMSTYARGSAAMAFDNANLAVDRIEHLGVLIDHVAAVDESALLPLSDRDRSKALALLRRDPPLPELWREQLSRMLHRQRKAEIEAYSSSGSSQVDGVVAAVSCLLADRLRPLDGDMLPFV